MKITKKAKSALKATFNVLSGKKGKMALRDGFIAVACTVATSACVIAPIIGTRTILGSAGFGVVNAINAGKAINRARRA